MRILLTGGGTGGHILPTLAVAAVLKEKLSKAQFLYVGRRSEKERELVAAAGFQYVAISTGKLRRYFSLQNAVDLFRFLQGIKEAAKVIDEFKPDVVFGKGGYVTLPVIIAAGRRGIPIVINESDSTLGLANRLGIRYATRIAVSFPVNQYLKNNANLQRYKSKFVFTGLPISGDILKPSKLKLFKTKRPTIFVTGGSQGAVAINHVVWSVLAELLQKYNVVHQTGVRNFAEATEYKASLPGELMDRYFIFDFARPEMVAALQQADVVVTRSGSSIFELEMLGKPAILVPLPTSAGDHQASNAKFLASKKAALLLPQRELSGDRLVADISKIMNTAGKRREMGAAMKKLGAQNSGAAERIAELILQHD